jgi:hypothetical protein
VSRLLLAAVAMLAAVPQARAQTRESPRRGSFTARALMYQPNIDSEFAGTGPYEEVFGSSSGWMFRGEYGWKIPWIPPEVVGAFEVGVGAGFSTRTGDGIDEATGTPSSDETKLRILPVTVSLGYRFDWLPVRYKIPLELHAKASLERYHWWVLDGGGETTQKGATNGYSFTLGAGFLLDIIDPNFAREADRDSGVNDTWLVVDVTKSFVDDFGSSDSWDLSDESWSLGFGVMFVF